jgi:peptide/nickel transport system substrate-binding protein
VIVQKFGLSVEGEVTQVENGQADWMFDPPPADRLNEMSTKYADQVHVNPLTAILLLRVWRPHAALQQPEGASGGQLRVDRNALVKIYGGPNLAVPTCQILPPNFPGYKPYCPYTKNPGAASGRRPTWPRRSSWSPQSGTKGAAVKVNTDTTDVNKASGLYFVDLLNSIGYKAQLPRPSRPTSSTRTARTPRTRSSSANSSWYQDYPAASDFLDIPAGLQLDPSEFGLQSRTSRSSAPSRSRRRWIRRLCRRSPTPVPQTTRGRRSTRRSPTRRPGLP